MQLTIDRVSKQYKNKIAVDRISLGLSPGVYGLLGANGAGKTTLMRMMCGILTPDGGEISLDGVDVGEEAYRDRLGYLPQDFGYYPEFSAMEFLLYIAAIKGISKSEAKRRAKTLLAVVGLEESAGKKVRTFSGGMKQRLGIAQALINDPQLIILDEPTAGLDPKERVRFRNMISKLGAKRIVLLSTHIVSDVEYIADQILLMKEGRIIHAGHPEEILSVIEGKVFECEVSPSEAEEIMTQHNVVNVRENGAKSVLRIVAEEPPIAQAAAAEVAVAEPTLEDLYLYYFNSDRERGM